MRRRERALPTLQSPHSLRSLRSFPLPSLRGLHPRNAPTYTSSISDTED